MKAKDFRKLDEEELKVKIAELRKKISDIYFEINTGKSKNIAEEKKMKKDLARALTIVSEIKLLKLSKK